MEDIQFWALDKDFQLVSILAPTNVQWNRKYYEPGNFTIQIPVEQYSNAFKCVFTANRPELGIICQTDYRIDNLGYQYVLISGYFLENELNDKVIYPAFIGQGPHVGPVIVKMVNKYKADIPLLEVPIPSISGTDTDFYALGEGLGEKAAYILKLHQMAYRVRYDYENNKKVFEIWQGVDRTNYESQYNPVTFSTAFGNLINPDVVVNDSQYKNSIVVHGQANDQDYFVQTSLAPEGAYKKWTYLDANIVYNENEMTLNEFLSQLIILGQQTLLEQYIESTNIAFDIHPEAYEYMVDYDLGDKCNIIINEIGLELTARIIAIYEVFKDGKHEISLELGNQVIKK